MKASVFSKKPEVFEAEPVNALRSNFLLHNKLEVNIVVYSLFAGFNSCLRWKQAPPCRGLWKRIQEAKEAILPTPLRHCGPSNKHDPSHAEPETWMPKSIWYKDGSKQVREDGVNVIGARIHNANRGTFSLHQS